MPSLDCILVGGGIVGLATAWSLRRRFPGLRLLVVEKEADWGLHQTGRNSGVIHSGIYYRPGSLKAQLGRAGNEAMLSFCREHGVAHERCGKIIVATCPGELEGLARLEQRARENGLDVTRLDPAAVRDREPHVRCLAALLVPSTGIVNFRSVCQTLVSLLAAQGVQLRTGAEVTGVGVRGSGVAVETTAGMFEGRFLVNCAGLQCDRVARLAGVKTDVRIIPFRGEYYELVPARRPLVRGLIYPVPNPEFPFLGVHFTRMIDGSVHAGPNAVLSLRREGYHRTAFRLGDAWDTLSFPGFWRLAARHAAEGAREMYRSFRKGAFTRSLQALVPEVRSEDLIPGEAGVRAQALRRDGSLVDDFLVERGPRMIHVLNAPSPAATASLEIGRLIAEQVPDPG